MGSRNTPSIGRRFVRFGDAYPKPDNLGFTLPSEQSLTLDDLCQFRCAFVRGAQWIGKSFVASQLEGTLRASESLQCDLMSLDLENWVPSEGAIPNGWAAWKQSSRRGMLIIDALDEGDFLCPNASHAISRLLKSLGTSELGRLFVYVFCRANEVPETFPETLEDLFKDEFIDVELLPLDRETAKSLLGAQNFEHTKSLIISNGLTQIAGYPVVLQTLALVDSSDSITSSEVWKRVLLELMTERRLGRHSGQQPYINKERLFDAAAHIAAAMSLSGTRQIGREVDITDLPKITEFVDGNHTSVQPKHLSHAVNTPLFQNGRFIKRNVQEWLAAFGMSQLTLDQLRPLVSPDEFGRFGQLTGVMALLCQASEDRCVREWIVEKSGGIPPAADAPLTLPQALLVLDNLEKIADSTSLRISHWRDKGIERLDVPGVVSAAAERLRDRSRSDNARSFLIDLCQLNDEVGPVDVAFEILTSKGEWIELRHKAAEFISEFTGEHCQDLLTLIQEQDPKNDREKALYSRVLIELLERGAITADLCVRFAPIPEGEVIDHTFILMDRIEESLTSEGATVVLERLIRPWLKRRSRPRTTPRQSAKEDLTIHSAWKEVAEKSFGLVLSESSLPRAMVDLIVKLLFHPRVHDFDRDSGVCVRELVRRNELMRRRVYHEELKRLKKKTGDRSRQYKWILDVEDCHWLKENSLKFSSMCDSVWNDLARLARWQKGKKKTEIRDFIRSHAAESLKQFDQVVRKDVQQLRRHNEKMAKREAELKAEHSTASLQLVVEEFFQVEDATPKSLWWSLCNVCFRPTRWKDHSISGVWEELPKELQHKVLQVCWKGLLDFTPTPLPSSTTLPRTVLAEAWCFSHFVMNARDLIESHPELVARWLPTIFVFPMENREVILSYCDKVESAAVFQALVGVVERDLRLRAESLVEIRSISENYWTAEFASSVVPFVTNPEFAEQIRSELLRIIFERRPEDSENLMKTFVDSDEKALRFEAIHWLAYFEPELFVERLAAESANDKAALELAARFSSFRTRHPPIHEWPTKTLVDLYTMLRSEIGRDGSAVEGGMVTTAHEVTDFYESIARVLMQRVDEKDSVNIASLLKQFPDLQSQFDYESTQARITSSLDESERNFLPLPDVVRLLSNPGYRIVRNADDLQNVLIETLRRIGADAPNHIEMLYFPKEISIGTKRRHESALQSYVACRLSDILPDRVIRREIQVSFRQRTDIEVIAVAPSGEQCTVIIEVKWSDNEDQNKNVSTGLTEQLGNIYLRENGNTHGIFLVGWNGRLGKWRKRANPRPLRKTPESLANRLLDQASEYHEQYPEILIEPVVFNLEWPTSSEA